MAKVHVKVDIQGVQVDETIEGADDAEIVRKMRDELARRAGLVGGMAIRALPDSALWARVVDEHNRRFGGSEAPPQTPTEFLEFAERAGYVTRLA